MFPQQYLPIGLLARLKKGEIGIQCVQGLDIGGIIAHGSDACSSSSMLSCNLRIARIQSICTAGRERFMRSATSLNGSRWRLRSRITS